MSIAPSIFHRNETAHLELWIVRQDCARKLREHIARAERVHAHALLRPLDRERARHVAHGRLRSVVRRLRLRDVHDLRGHGAHEGDGTAAARDHDPGGLARGEERAVHIDVEQPLHAVERVVERGVVLHNAWAPCGKRTMTH